MANFLTRMGLELTVPELGDIVTIKPKGDWSLTGEIMTTLFEVMAINGCHAVLKPRGNVLVNPGARIMVPIRACHWYEASDLLIAFSAKEPPSVEPEPGPARPHYGFLATVPSIGRWPPRIASVGSGEPWNVWHVQA